VGQPPPGAQIRTRRNRCSGTARLRDGIIISYPRRCSRRCSRCLFLYSSMAFNRGSVECPHGPTQLSNKQGPGSCLARASVRTSLIILHSYKYCRSVGASLRTVSTLRLFKAPPFFTLAFSLRALFSFDIGGRQLLRLYKATNDELLKVASFGLRNETPYILTFRYLNLPDRDVNKFNRTIV
jgi:hypothetical protein